MNELVIEKFTIGMCQTNCYYLYRQTASKIKEAVFIDPAERGEDIYRALQKKGISVKAILFTHGHFDHIMGSEELKRLSGAKVYAPAGEKQLLEDPYVNCSADFMYSYTCEADEYFKDGDILELLPGIECRIIETPGHTVGSSSLYFEKDNVLFSGDTLFYESVGRTDLPTGSMGKLIHSVRERLFALPENCVVYPGHGPQTDIGHEKEYNPYS